MRPSVVAGPVTLQTCFPSLGALDSMGAQLLPPSRERSTLTFPLKPLEVHLRVTLWLMCNTSPPFGLTTVIRAPVPLTTGETLPPLDVKLTFPVKLPVAVGAKRTTMVWLVPAPRLKGVPETTEEGADVEALPVRALPPVSWTVKVRSAELPTDTLPKSCEAGVTLMSGGLAGTAPMTPVAPVPPSVVK